MTDTPPTRQALLDALIVERFGPPRAIRRERPPRLVGGARCSKCGRATDPNKPCPECRLRRAASA